MSDASNTPGERNKPRGSTKHGFSSSTYGKKKKKTSYSSMWQMRKRREKLLDDLYIKGNHPRDPNRRNRRILV